MANGVGFGEDLGKDDHQCRHDQRGIGDAGIARELDQEVGGDRGGEHVEEVVAEQQRADQLFLVAQEPLRDSRTPTAAAGQLVDARGRGAGHRRFRT